MVTRAGYRGKSADGYGAALRKELISAICDPGGAVLCMVMPAYAYLCMHAMSVEAYNP